jgi:hypothetical protein
VARHLPVPRHKVRTREHVIADLGVNHVERHLLLAGFAVNRFEQDYGLDLCVTTFDAHGEVESSFFWVQVKATDKLKRVARERAVSFPLEVRDVRAWRGEMLPVFLVVYDAPADAAYWLYVQAYFAVHLPRNLARRSGKIKVRIPITNVLDTATCHRFAAWKNRVLEQGTGGIHHYE